MVDDEDEMRSVKIKVEAERLADITIQSFQSQDFADDLDRTSMN